MEDGGAGSKKSIPDCHDHDDTTHELVPNMLTDLLLGSLQGLMRSNIFLLSYLKFTKIFIQNTYWLAILTQQ